MLNNLQPVPSGGHEKGCRVGDDSPLPHDGLDLFQVLGVVVDVVLEASEVLVEVVLEMTPAGFYAAQMAAVARQVQRSKVLENGPQTASVVGRVIVHDQVRLLH